MSPSRPPTPEEAAAIAAAVEVLWPRPTILTEAAPTPTRWKFSGRWWLSGSPVAAQRRRP